MSLLKLKLQIVRGDHPRKLASNFHAEEALKRDPHAGDLYQCLTKFCCYWR
jgi:hypothetical protein